MNIENSQVYLKSKILSFKSFINTKTDEDNFLMKVPPRIMVYLVAILSLSALFIEIKFFPEMTKEIFIVRSIATLIALSVLFLLNPKASPKRQMVLFHILLLTVIISSGLMIYLIHSTLLLNSSYIGLMIFTSALLLSWEVTNQVIVAIYYNLIFLAVLILTNMKLYSFPFMYEAMIFVFVLSVVSVVACAVNYKVRKLEEEKNSEIKKSEHKYRSIIDNSIEGIFQSTLDGKWITINKSFAQILGYSDEHELQNINVKEIYAVEKDREKLLGELKKYGKVENYRIKLKRKDGSIAIVRINDRLVEDENGMIRFEGNIYDITEQVKAEEERQNAEEMLRKEKEKTEKLAMEAMHISGTKSKFMANLSHEIRTPMNGILGFLTLIEAGAYSNQEELKLFSSNARQSAESLLDIINSILDLSKIEAGKVKAEKVHFNLLNVVEQSISVISMKAKEKGINIIRDIPESTETMLVGDMVKLRQILVNLLNNAVKFTYNGEIKLSISTINKTKKEVELKVAVTDTGIGIPESKQKDLFKPYFQVSDFDESSSRGTGLGLVICKEYVELLGGRISITSKEGEGSSFSFSIKCELQTDANATDIRTTERIDQEGHQILADSEAYFGNGLKHKREKFNILLAEDNLINQKVTLKILNTFGFNVKAVLDGQEAVAAIENDNFDLVLMDLQMPKVDGFKATEKIRNLKNGKKDIPIIALTAHALQGDKEKCLQAGMTDYISKPISGQDLVRKIDILLEIRSNDSSENNELSREKKIFLDKNRLKSISLGDFEFEKDLLASYKSDLDEKFKHLIELISNKDMKKIIEISHSIKGSSYSIGAVKVGDEAYAIELSGKNNDWINVKDRIEKLGKIIENTNVEIEDYIKAK